jgi:hypothetical protein
VLYTCATSIPATSTSHIQGETSACAVPFGRSKKISVIKKAGPMMNNRSAPGR